jgi:hypothetical protein
MGHIYVIGKKVIRERTLGRPRRMWWTILSCFWRDGIGWYGLDDLAHDRKQWSLLWTWYLTFRLHDVLGSSSVAAQLAASPEGLRFMEFIGLEDWKYLEELKNCQLLDKDSVSWRNLVTQNCIRHQISLYLKFSVCVVSLKEITFQTLSSVTGQCTQNLRLLL